jgi:hypothetical protein
VDLSHSSAAPAPIAAVFDRSGEVIYEADVPGGF